jgi:hypothetical protein
MTNAIDNAGKLSKVFNLLEPRFGAVPGAANNTAAIQAAINAAQAVGGTLEIPEGTWRASALTISDNLRITGTEPFNCILQQIAGSNTNFITIAYTVVQNPIIENITIDGNRTGNLTSGHALYLPDHAEIDPSVTYGFSVVLRNAYVINAREDCLHVGVNRNMGHIENSEFKRGARCLYIKDASDWRVFHGRFAFPLAGSAVEIASGAVNAFFGGAAYGALAYPCIKLSSTGPSPTQFIGMTINNSDREGVYIVGASGLSRTIGHTFIGCAIGGNSLSANNTYSNVKLEDTKDSIFVGNYFQGTAGNKPKYLVEFIGAAGAASWSGNTYESTSFGTAVSNSPALLTARLQTLISEQETILGGTQASDCSLLVAKGTTGGNYIAVTGRAAGTPADIAPRGADTNINLRLYSKGTGNIEMAPGAVRAARVMYTASAVNYTDIYGSVAGQPLQLLANGTDTNIDIRFVPKGTGRVRFGTHTGTADTAVSGYIEIVDSGGTIRKLAVIT